MSSVLLTDLLTEDALVIALRLVGAALVVLSAGATGYRIGLWCGAPPWPYGAVGMVCGLVSVAASTAFGYWPAGMGLP